MYRAGDGIAVRTVQTLLPGAYWSWLFTAVDVNPDTAKPSDVLPGLTPPMWYRLGEVGLVVLRLAFVVHEFAEASYSSQIPDRLPNP